MNHHLSAEFWLVLNAIWVAPVTAKLSSKTEISKINKIKRWKRNKSNSATWTRKQTKSHNSSYRRRNWDSFQQKIACIKFTASSAKYFVAIKQHDSLWPSRMLGTERTPLRRHRFKKWQWWQRISRVLWTPNKDSKSKGEDSRNQRRSRPRVYAISIDRNSVHVYKIIDVQR